MVFVLCQKAVSCKILRIAVEHQKRHSNTKVNRLYQLKLHQCVMSLEKLHQCVMFLGKAAPVCNVSLTSYTRVCSVSLARYTKVCNVSLTRYTSV